MPTEPDGLSLGDCTREGWRITRSALGSLAAITAIPMVVLNLLYIPFWISISTMFEGLVRFMFETDWSRYRYDPEGLQRDMQAAMQPMAELSAIASAATGLAVIVGIVAVAALTAATIDSAAGRPVSIGRAYLTAIGQPAIVVPALILGIGYVAVFVPLALIQPGVIYGGAMPTSPGLAALFGVVALVLEIGAIYLAVRWALYFQVVVEERLGVRAGLARAAALSAGVRVRIAVVMLVLSLLVGLLVSIVVGLPALIIALLARSALVGLVAASVAFSVAALVYLPFIVAVLTYVYRRRVEETPAVVPPA
jgi:uncharacterized membrane protein YtjA (UPF0391 family)